MSDTTIDSNDHKFSSSSFRLVIELSDLKLNSEGLIPAIVQESTSKEVLMMAWMNLESVKKTVETGRTWFWSRSRKEYWQKGETSGDRQWVREIFYDCDSDVLLIKVDQEGNGACHTGNYSCFFREVATRLD